MPSEKGKTAERADWEETIKSAVLYQYVLFSRYQRGLFASAVGYKLGIQFWSSERINRLGIEI